MIRSRVRASHEATLTHRAEAVWRYVHWPNLELMRPSGFFADIVYDDIRPVAGATRTIRLGGNGNGTPLREVLEVSDPTAMHLCYRIIDPAPMPVADYRGEVQVHSLTATRCVVRFSSECVLNDIDAATWRDSYCAMQRASIDFISRALTAV